MTIFFPDVSNHQAGLSLHGAVAVIAKATQGDWYTDPTYGGFKAQADQLGAPFMGYHWPDTGDLQSQAQRAYSVLGSTPTMWDAEAAGATVPRLVELTHRLRDLGGNPRTFYLPHWFWQQLGSPDLTPLTDLGLTLISSDYTAYSDDGPGWTPYGGATPQQWQYTDAQQFNGMAVDFNAFKGTVDDLRRLWGYEGGDVSSEDVIVGESQLYDQAASRSTPTGRNFANDVYTVQRAADGFGVVNGVADANLKTRLDNLDAGIADIKAALAALQPDAGPVAAHTHVPGEVSPAVAG
jgi:hypothetical protein